MGMQLRCSSLLQRYQKGLVEPNRPAGSEGPFCCKNRVRSPPIEIPGKSKPCGGVPPSVSPERRCRGCSAGSGSSRRPW